LAITISTMVFPELPFTVLSCNTDAKNVRLNMGEGSDEDSDSDDENPAATVAACVEDYKQTHAFIDEFHDTLKDTLSTKVEVDSRFGLGENGIYQEPLERALEYLGLSMNKDQVVNASIDGQHIKRALIPFHVLNAKVWYDTAHQSVPATHDPHG
jgi:hypothetical protein